jgi:alpha,alpha-trehalase
MSSPVDSSLRRLRISNEIDPYSAAHIYYAEDFRARNHNRTRTFSVSRAT